ncbi:MAG: septal ring lytic transglycosylase RlpA family protein [Sumerlaeia bacterium]
MRRFLPILLLTLVLAGCGTSNKGTASWYADPFTGRPTASGERFNPNDLTAAHAHYPFGTRLKVTNLDNGKSVIVRVNDRFPGTKGRVIDLSKAAFARIAHPDQGLARVRIQVVSGP